MDKQKLKCPTCKRGFELNSQVPETCRRCGTDLIAISHIARRANSFFEQGRAFFKQQQFEKAHEMFLGAWKLKKSHKTQKALAAVLICSGRYKAGIKQLNSRIKRMNEDMKKTTQHQENANNSIKNISCFSQKDSDLFAQFIQITKVLQTSKWHEHTVNSILHWNIEEGMKANLPSFEYTVFALTCIRQFVGQDDLLNETCERYQDFIDDTKRENIVKRQNNFTEFLNGNISGHSDDTCLHKYFKNNRQFIDAFLYGALIVHGPEKSYDTHRQRYKQMYNDKENKERYLYALNHTILEIMVQASGIAVILQEDFLSWINQDLVPKPDIFWHEIMWKWMPLDDKV